MHRRIDPRSGGRNLTPRPIRLLRAGSKKSCQEGPGDLSRQGIAHPSRERDLFEREFPQVTLCSLVAIGEEPALVEIGRIDFAVQLDAGAEHGRIFEREAGGLVAADTEQIRKAGFLPFLEQVVFKRGKTDPRTDHPSQGKTWIDPAGSVLVEEEVQRTLQEIDALVEDAQLLDRIGETFPDIFRGRQQPIEQRVFFVFPRLFFLNLFLRL